MIEWFIIALYDSINIHRNVHEAQREIFCKKSSHPENVPPKQYALHLHVMKVLLLVKCSYVEIFSEQHGIFSLCNV